MSADTINILLETGYSSLLITVPEKDAGAVIKALENAVKCDAEFRQEENKLVYLRREAEHPKISILHDGDIEHDVEAV